MLAELVRAWAGLTVRSATLIGRSGGNLLRQADMRIGAWRLTPDGYRDLRDLAVARLREILEVPDAAALLHRPEADGAEQPPDEEAIRAAFQRLLDESRLITDAVRPHPAFAAIVEELCPDEARVLRLFCEEGPQPSVIVVAAPWIGRGARTLAEHLSLLGDRAGCLAVERAPTYVTNLVRLGLLTIDETELVGHPDYELIEVSERANELRSLIEDERNQRARIHRCTLRLSPLGQDFCALVMPPADG